MGKSFRVIARVGMSVGPVSDHSWYPTSRPTRVASSGPPRSAMTRSARDKPLVVLSAGVGSAGDWPRKQQRLAALSTDSVHRVVDGASHEALVGDPIHAATTSGAILEVVSAARTGQPLSR